jgi:hypothetical protein
VSKRSTDLARVCRIPGRKPVFAQSLRVQDVRVMTLAPPMYLALSECSSPVAPLKRFRPPAVPSQTDQSGRRLPHVRLSFPQVFFAQAFCARQTKSNGPDKMHKLRFVVVVRFQRPAPHGPDGPGPSRLPMGLVGRVRMTCGVGAGNWKSCPTKLIKEA